MNKALSYSVYPATLMLAYAIYYAVLSLSGIPFLGLYLAISTAAFSIFLLEKFYPLHVEWIPDWDDLKSDVFFYSLIIQVLFPLSLFFCGVWILSYWGFENAVLYNFWPHQWNKFYQFLLLSIAGELFWYGWHRLCHSSKFFWPIHAIHHLPNKLYSWNTARFHYLDKLYEFIFTIFLFFLFGLSVEVFCLYYIFYAITGYVQHSNLNIQLGVFDYVIASGETHRFHHDPDPHKSKCNYANNLVVFDLLFKTFKRDVNNPVKKVGMQSELKPAGIIEESYYPIKHFSNRIEQLFFKTILNTVVKTKVDQLKKAALNPSLQQNELLLKIVDSNKETQFGKDFHFADIKTVDDYRRLVPIQDYEGHRAYVDKIINDKSNALTQQVPHSFTKTSGTTGKPKYLPVTMDVQKSFLFAQQCLSYSLFLKAPRYLEGEVFSIVGLAEEEKINGLWSCGSMSGKLFSLAHSSIRKKQIFQTEIAYMKDSEQKFFYLAALALLSPRTTFYASPNPSSFLIIFETINNKREDLKKLLIKGDDPLILKHKKRIRRALQLLDLNRTLTAIDVWPQLVMATMWKEGSCSYLIPKVRSYLSSKTHLCELGLIASEFYATAPIDENTDNQIPTLMDHFFEFIERSNYDNGSRDTLLVHQLEAGSEYYLIVTTKGGLYRYFINDLVKVHGHYHQTPIMSFSQKGKGVTNITGEKISEKQLVQFFADVNKTNEGDVKFFMVLADQLTQKYRVYVETDEKIADLELKINEYLKNVNVEFAAKINDQRLAPLEVVYVKPKTGEKYKSHCLSKGQSEAQFKFLYLHYKKDVDFNFDEYVVV